MEKEKAAAIALALHTYFSESVHDRESYRITIVRKESAWNLKGQNFRQLPK